MTIGQILDTLYAFAPRELVAPWDHCGLQVGDAGADCTGIVTCLDVTLPVIREATEHGCNLIVSHHPLLFHGLQTVCTGDAVSEIVVQAVRSGIHIIAMHTNLDACDGGINDAWMQQLECTDVQGSGSFERIGTGEAIRFADWVERVRSLSCDRVRAVGAADKVCSKICVSSGSGGRDEATIVELRRQGVDILITSEIKHSVACALAHYGICWIELTHYAGEVIAAQLLADALSDTGLPIRVSQSQTSPYREYLD